MYKMFQPVGPKNGEYTLCMFNRTSIGHQPPMYRKASSSALQTGGPFDKWSIYHGNWKNPQGRCWTLKKKRKLLDRDDLITNTRWTKSISVNHSPLRSFTFTKLPMTSQLKTYSVPTYHLDFGNVDYKRWPKSDHPHYLGQIISLTIMRKPNNWTKHRWWLNKQAHVVGLETLFWTL